MKKVLALIALAAVVGSAQATLVYDNIGAPSGLSGATTDAQTNAIWGDQVTLASTGKLDTFKMGLFNSSFGGNTGSLLTAVINIKFYNLGSTPYTSGVLGAPLIGQFNGTVDFGTGLNPDFYSIISFTGLASLNLTLTQNVMITQQVTSFTGGTNRLGVMTYSTETVGSSFGADKFYRKNSSAEGLIGFNSPTSNKLAYQVGIVPEPATLTILALGAAALIRRRRV